VAGCLSENAIQELVAGMVSGDELAAAHDHLEACPACRTLVIELARDQDRGAIATGPTLPLRGAPGAEPHGAAEPGLSETPADKGPAAPPKLGGALGRYAIEGQLGAGGMGVVYAAFDPDLERRVALKVLRSDGISEEMEERLLREARAMARLTHPNVVAVYDVGSTVGRDYVAMELIDGESLAEWLRAAPRGERAILAAFRDAGRGLAAAHAAGIVHRDFKPHNVLRSRAGRIAVTDFGLAREAAPERGAGTPPGSSSQPQVQPLSGLTVPGGLLGTPAYMAPEQWDGGDRMRAELLIAPIPQPLFAGPKLGRAIADAEAAVARVRQPFLVGWLAAARGMVAYWAGQAPEALALYEAAVASLRARSPRRAAEIAVLRLEVLARHDPPRVAAELAAARALAAAGDAGALVDRLEHAAAWASWVRGDVAEAHRRLEAMGERTLPALPGERRLQGAVVDEAGRPVAGALVAGGEWVFGDSLEIGMDAMTLKRASERTRTDARGRFTLERRRHRCRSSRASSSRGISRPCSARRSARPRCASPACRATSAIPASGKPSTGGAPSSTCAVRRSPPARTWSP
jgi:predicted Ser/Thr protein kinase